jgi:hypothetical protein
MSYQRVIPRDLFNEANLLKCMGQLWLNLEKLNLPDVEMAYDDESFDIDQCQDTGATFVRNITLVVNDEVVVPWRPLNSREPYPLYITRDNGDEISIFNDEGWFTPEMLFFLKESQQ